MICALLLAAGESSRMGSLKQLVELDGKCLLEHSLGHLAESQVDMIFIILGAEHRKIMSKLELKGDKVKVVVNEDFRKGMSSSIKRGMNEIPPACEALLICLGDMPVVSARAIDSLIEAFKSGGKGIAAPFHAGRRGHPVIFSSQYFPLLLELEGDRGGASILEENSEDILKIEVDDPGILVDIDIREDLERLEQKSADKE